MTNVSLTKNETSLLIAFAHCQMNATNGNPKFANDKSELATYTWLDERDVNGLSIASKKGVLSSLVKKNLVTTAKDDEGDYLSFTDLGFETVMNLIKTDEPSETKTETNPESEETVIYYRFKKIASRFNSNEQFKIFSDLDVPFGPVKETEDYLFWITENQTENLVKAIRDSKIFSRFTAEKLSRYLDK